MVAKQVMMKVELLMTSTEEVSAATMERWACALVGEYACA
jgi:hypothetical protein